LSNSSGSSTIVSGYFSTFGFAFITFEEGFGFGITSFPTILAL
jgi:hypothetical protein